MYIQISEPKSLKMKKIKYGSLKLNKIFVKC